ncbi:MAG: tyrosine-type recombinase/integrase [Clostridium sp.]
MLKNEVITRILGRSMLEMEDLDQLKLRDILEQVLYDYQVTSCCKEIALVNDVQDKIVLFLASKQIEGLSAESIKNYKYQLAQFSTYMSKDIEKISAMDIRMYLATISKEKGLKATSIANVTAILKSFFTWLETEEYILKSPMRKVKAPKVPKHLRKALNIEQIELLRGGCKTIRQRALFEFMFSTGCRVSEIVNVDINDIDWSSYTLKVIGKGNKERVVYFTPKTKIYLKEYLVSRSDNNPALFVASKGTHERLGKRSMQRELKDIASNANFDVSVYPHLIRHSMATTALAGGVSLNSIQHLLGHDSPATTQIYAELNQEEVRNEYRKYMTA